MDCLDCKYCKVNISKRTLRCREGHWVYDNLMEKHISLGDLEAETLRIKPRKLFLQGKNCRDMDLL